MYIIVNHYIKDPDAFWKIVRERPDIGAQNIKVHAVYPSPDMLRAICLWEAPSIAEIDGFLSDNFADLVSNDYFYVNEEAAMGLPQVKQMA
ncbi:MAG TPA: hypothetical protein VFZ78_10625 [Flavisolibacter sp.]